MYAVHPTLCGCLTLTTIVVGFVGTRYARRSTILPVEDKEVTDTVSLASPDASARGDSIQLFITVLAIWP